MGSALTPALRAAGHDVVRLVRRKPVGADEVFWDPAAGSLDASQLGDIDAIINLAGENLGKGRWTAARKERIFRSRVDATRTLVAAMKQMPRKPRVFLSASAVGFYGDRGEEPVDESSEIGQGFLPEVCLAWETHAEGARPIGVRVVLLRFGVVLAAKGGALAKMLPIFRFALGGRLGSGEQWMSWVSLQDIVGAVQHLLTENVAGPVNVVSPHAVTNREFTATLAAVLRRPAMLSVPAWALRLILGRGMADEALLASCRAVPSKLVDTGYRFQTPELGDALRAIL